MVLFRITENEPSKMHNVRPYVYSRPWSGEHKYTITGHSIKHFGYSIYSVPHKCFPMTSQKTR